MPRLFLAVRPSPEVIEQIRALPRPAEPGVRYSSAEQWHVTIRFFGEAEPDEVDAALSRLSFDAAEALLGPVVRRLGKRVVVVPVSGLEEMAEAVGEATRQIGSPPDDRPFRGHMTVARLKRRGTCELVGQPISGRFRADRVTLVKSTLGTEGAHHEDLHDYTSSSR